MRIKFGPDVRAEQVLSSLGIAGEYREVPARQIDVAGSRKNKARLSANLLPDLVDDYEEGMRAGDVFPSIVLAKVDTRRKWLIAGGNHRHEAAVVRCGETDLHALTCSIDEVTFDLLTWKLNMVEGQRVNREDRVQRAVDLVVQRGLTATEAAEELRVSPATVQVRVRCLRIRKAFADAGSELPESVPNNVVDKLHRLIDDDTSLMHAAADYVCAAKPSGDEAAATVHAAARKRTLETKAQVFRDRTPNTPKQGTKRTRPFEAKVRQNLSILETVVLKCDNGAMTGMPRQEREELWDRASLILDKLRSILLDG